MLPLGAVKGVPAKGTALFSRRTLSLHMLPVASLTTQSPASLREVSQQAKVTAMLPTDVKPVRIALVGAGIFMKNAHIPGIARLNQDTPAEQPPFEVVAVYSRTESSAKGAVEAVEAAMPAPSKVELFTDLDAMLARSDIEAVDIALPAQIISEAIQKSLTAGKHVLSEKPIAAQSSAARELISLAASKPDLVWMVAENFRYETVFQRAAELVRSGKIGRPLVAQWSLHVPVGPSMPYYNTAWRGKGQGLRGGWFLDMGVHHIATLRALLGDVAEVSAHSTSFKDDLQPPDTVAATLRFQSGALCNYSVCCAGAAGWPDRLSVVGDSGSLQVSRKEKQIFVAENSAGGAPGKLEAVQVDAFDGVDRELVAFVRSIRKNESNLNSPEEGLKDLAVIEAILQSAETGQRVTLRK